MKIPDVGLDTRLGGDMIERETKEVKEVIIPPFSAAQNALT